jgi:hypothetical protein
MAFPVIPTMVVSEHSPDPPVKISMPVTVGPINLDERILAFA